MPDDMSDKRLYRRVDVLIPFGFRTVDRAVVDTARRGVPLRVASSGDDPVHAVLERIEHKVDGLLRRLDGGGDDAPPVTLRSVNLSGAGVRFGSEFPVEPGVCVDLVLVLPGEPAHRVRVFGEVVRQRKLARPSGGIYELAVSFLTLSPRDREWLIRYTFQTVGP
ncbi:MAG: PilZ domain-containing protein [Nitrospiria bacterium]